MLGAIAGEFLVQSYTVTGALPEDGTLPKGIHITGIVLRILGVAQGLRECDAQIPAAADECAYWVDAFEHEYVHEGFDPDEEAPPETVSVQAGPTGLVAEDTEDAEALAREICEGGSSGVVLDAQVLAGAVCLACEGAGTEQIASYVLSRELPPDSPVLMGTGALLKAESFEEAVCQALEHDFGTEAALAAACMAEPLYGVPDELADSVWEVLTPDLRTVAEDFQEFVLTRRADR